MQVATKTWEAALYNHSECSTFQYLNDGNESTLVIIPAILSGFQCG